MTLLRYAILALLFYIGWRLLREIIRDRIFGPSADSGRDSGQKGEGEDVPVQDTLREDPVCHTLVPQKQAIRLRRNGKTFYFCSEGCCDKFLDNPRGEE